MFMMFQSRWGRGRQHITNVYQPRLHVCTSAMTALLTLEGAVPLAAVDMLEHGDLPDYRFCRLF